MAGSAARLLQDKEHRADDRFGAGAVADAPARHRISLRKAVDQDRPLAGIGGNRSGRDVPPAVVNQGFVDLVADDQVFFCAANPMMSTSSSRSRTVPTGFHGVLSKRTSVPVADAASSWRLPNVNRPDCIVVCTGYRSAAPERDRRFIGVVNRVGQQDALVLVDECAQGRTDTERGPVGDQDLAVGIVRQPLVALEFSRDSPAQRRLPLVIGITGAAVAQGLLRRLDNVRAASAYQAVRA